MIEKIRAAVSKVLMELGSSISPFEQDTGTFHKDIYGRQIKDAEVFFYPQKIRGIPVFDIESVMKHYQKEIRELRDFVPLGDHQTDDKGRDLFQVMYLDVLERFAEYIHLIPASEDHHHRGPGGLLIHSIQTAQKALVFAETKKFKKTGFIDHDKELAIRARYATWVAGLMHDTGKILRDIHVDAVEQISSNGKTAPAQNVATWAPHLQTLIEWAKTNSVASYAISYRRDRVHNAHNMDSSHLLPYILGRGHAMKYLVEAPGENLYSELAKVLSGIDSSSYISRAVKEGDSYSTMKDVAVYHDIMSGAKQLSVGSRVVMLMKLAKSSWQWNTPGGEGWIIAGHCYLRWPNAIQSIIKESIRLNIAIPHDNLALVSLMENHGLIKLFDNKHRASKFSKGQFDEVEVQQIIKGEKSVVWEELIRVTWDGHLFGDDPKPNNCKGLMYQSETGEYTFVDRAGISRFTVNAEPTENNSANSEEAAVPALATSTASAEQSPPATAPEKAPAAKGTKKTKKQAEPTPAPEQAQASQTETEQEQPKQAEPEQEPEKKKRIEPTFTVAEIDTSTLNSEEVDVQSSKGVQFTRKPSKQESKKSTSLESVKPVPAINSEKQTKPTQDTPKQDKVDVPKAIMDIAERGGQFWIVDGEVYLEVDKDKGIGAAELKSIKSQYLAIETSGSASLATNTQIGGRKVLASKLRTPIARMLILSGIAVEASKLTPPPVTTSEVNTSAVSKGQGEFTPSETDFEMTSENTPSMEDIMNMDYGYQESLAIEPDFTPPPPAITEIESVEPAEPPPLEYITDGQTFKEGTLGWILECSGQDIASDTIRFDKNTVKDAATAAGRKLNWTKIESVLRTAGHEVVRLEEGHIEVSKSALNTHYWTV